VSRIIKAYEEYDQKRENKEKGKKYGKIKG
jgi:hypothetical protein